MGEVSVIDFPRFAKPGNSAVFFGGNGLETTTQVFNTDIEKFHDQVIVKKDGSIYIVVRTCGDEREDLLLQDPADDELDRNYTVFGKVIDGFEHVEKIKRGDSNNNGSVSDPDKIISFRSL